MTSPAKPSTRLLPVIAPADENAIGVAVLAPLLAWSLLDWTPLTEIDATWRLGAETAREIQRLRA